VHVVSTGPLVVHVASPTRLSPAPEPARSASSPDGSVAGGLLEVVRTDAVARAREGLLRRGPTRVLALAVATLSGLGALGAVVAWSTVGALALGWLLPCGIVAVAALWVAVRTERGPLQHPLEPAVLRYAFAHAGVVRLAPLAHETGHSLRECQEGLDALVAAGHVVLDSDEQGGLLYRFPDAQPEATR